MAKRWAASTLLETEKSFRKIMGFKDLWMLDASLKKDVDNTEKAALNIGKSPATFHYGWDNLNKYITKYN
ncbi:MAG: hypothetical protein ACYC27_16665 [Armatimonadota bacterium]